MAKVSRNDRKQCRNLLRKDRECMYVITHKLRCDGKKDGRDGIADQDQGAS